MSDPAADLAVRLRGVTKRYGPVTAVDGIDLDIRQGEQPRTVRGGNGESALAGLDAATRVDVVRVRVRQRLESYEPPPRASSGPPDEPVMRTLLGDGGSAQVPVHDWARLPPGSRVDGPAVAAGGSMTCLVRPGWALEVDELGDAVLRRDRLAPTGR
jgi:N-methylhydantoinase A/oxoprolinase/acetone carboxylase beta subunit